MGCFELCVNYYQVAQINTCEAHMEGQTKERWLELCAQAAVEPDPTKLLQLVKEINRLLEEKGRRRRAEIIPSS